MALKLSYFAWVRERMGIAEEVIDAPGGVATVGDLIGWLAIRDSRGAFAFAEPARIRAAVDGMMAAPGVSIAEASEVALFPPVTGGGSASRSSPRPSTSRSRWRRMTRAGMAQARPLSGGCAARAG